jgi:hypothetical protein
MFANPDLKLLDHFISEAWEVRIHSTVFAHWAAKVKTSRAQPMCHGTAAIFLNPGK